jgi:hypothetical protein
MPSFLHLSLAAITACAAAAPPPPSTLPQFVQRPAPVLAASAPAPKRDHAPGAVLVRFEPDTSEEVRAFARIFVGGVLVRSFSLVPGLEQLAVTVPVDDALNVLHKIPGVEFAEPDYTVHASPVATRPGSWPSPATIPVIADLGRGLAAAGAGVVTTWTNPAEIPANGLDDDANGYVDDVLGYDFVNNDPDPTDDGAPPPTTSPTDPAPGAIMPLRVLDASGAGLVSDAIASLEYALAMGAGASRIAWANPAPSAAWTAALDTARARGQVILTPDLNADADAPSDLALAPSRRAVPAAGPAPNAPSPPRSADPSPTHPLQPTSAPNAGAANANPPGPRGTGISHASAQDLDISLGFLPDPVERFIPSIATWRYIQAAVDSSGDARGIQVVDASPHDAKVATGNNAVWFGVDFIADRTDRQQYLGGEVSADAGCLVYIDPGTTPSTADLCFAVIVGSRYAVCRLPEIVRPGVRVSFQACYRLEIGDWQLNAYHGPPSGGNPPRVTRASTPRLGSSLVAFKDSEISIMRHWGTIPGALTKFSDLLTTGPQVSFFQHGSFTGKLFAFEYHPSTTSPLVPEFPQPTRAKVSFTFRGLSQDPTILTNRGTAREFPECLLSGPTGNRISTGVWLPPNRDALAGDLASVGDWLRRLGDGERCVAIVIGDSNSAAAEGGLADALIQSVMTYYAGQGYDARPDVYWSATMSDNHPLRQYAGLGGRISYGGDVSISPDDIPITSGFGPNFTIPFPIPQAPFTPYEWTTYAGSGMHTHRPGANSLGLLSAFATSDTSDTARWRMPNIYAVQNTPDGAMNDPRSGHARLVGSGLLYARTRMKAGDLVCIEAVLGQRETNPGGSIQFALRAQDGSDAALNRLGRLTTAGGSLSGSGPGWMTVDASAFAVDAQREALAAAYTGYPGQPLRPASMDVWSTPTPPLSGIGSRGFVRVRTQPWVMGEIDIPQDTIAIDPTPVSYQPYILLKRHSICSMLGVRIIRNLNPGQDHPRLPWTVAMLGIGGTRAVDQMSWLFADPQTRVLRDAYWRHVLDALNARGAHVLFIHVESQNSAGQATGVPADALNDASTTWAGYTGAKIRALHTLAQRAGAASFRTIAINSARLTSDGPLPRGEVLRGIAPLIEHCAAIDLYRVIGQRDTMDSLWALHPYLAPGFDTAHPHYTVLGPPALGNAFAAGLEAANGGR